jgi:multidrug efflux system membrane fusion protein
MGWFILALGAVAVGYWFLPRPAPAPEDKKAKDKPPVPVLVAKAQSRDMPVVLDLVGRAEAYASVTLKPRLDGQVAEMAFAEGQHVKAGQVLVRLDEGDFAARLRQAEANLARDQANVAKARADVVRYGTLKDQGFVSTEKLDEVRAVLAAAEATVQADQAAVDLARLQLGYTLIRAPFDGIVGARLVHPGTAVKSNDTALAVVNRVQPLYVTFALPEKYLGPLRTRWVQGGLKAKVRLPGEPDEVEEGELRFLDNAVDAATGTIQMKAVLPNKNERLTPGQFLDVSLVLETLKNVVTVPLEAVQQGPEGSFVYVVQPDQTVRQRPVKLAFSRAGQAVLSAGLAPGETVVTDGHARLTPKSKVKIKEPKSAAPAPQ